MRLLLVEDDPMIGESLEEGLCAEHYAVDWVRDGGAAQRAAASEVYDLILLDLGLPGKQGIDVLTSYRDAGGDAAALVITARDAAADKIRALDTSSAPKSGSVRNSLLRQRTLLYPISAPGTWLHTTGTHFKSNGNGRMLLLRRPFATPAARECR